ncbi:hypothetical protein F2P81_018412 [Scophthalmus maximus]|uniref:Uncharacterized protein n=1 Tax=Scophthalmus maximus TaxID=52904 RepID=A0A6A4S859_SCOMX|nr:hypothetical protein F2P81_018412 [Scophthalmus maximus]
MESWMKVMTDAALVHSEPVRRLDKLKVDQRTPQELNNLLSHRVLTRPEIQNNERNHEPVRQYSLSRADDKLQKDVDKHNGQREREYYTLQRDGEQYSLKKDGVSYMLQKDGEKYLLHKDGEKYLLRKDGEKYSLQKDGEVYTIHRDLEKYAVQKVGEKYSVSTTDEKYAPSKDGEKYLLTKDGEKYALQKFGDRHTLKKEGQKYVPQKEVKRQLSLKETDRYGTMREMGNKYDTIHVVDKYGTLKEVRKYSTLREGDKYATLRDAEKYATVRDSDKYGFQRDPSLERSLTKISSIKLQPAQAAAIAAAVSESIQGQANLNVQRPAKVNSSGSTAREQTENCSPADVDGSLTRGPVKSPAPVQEPKRGLSRTNSMQQLENWVRTHRSRGVDDDTRSITSYQTLPRNMPSHRPQIVPRYPEGYRTLPRNSMMRPDSICSMVGSVYDCALGPASTTTVTTAEKRKSMRDDTMWQLYEWQQRQAFSRQSLAQPTGLLLLSSVVEKVESSLEGGRVGSVDIFGIFTTNLSILLAKSTTIKNIVTNATLTRLTFFSSFCLIEAVGHYGTLPSTKTMGNISEHAVAHSIPTSPSHGSLALYSTFSAPRQQVTQNPSNSFSEVSSPVFRGDVTLDRRQRTHLAKYGYPADRRSIAAGVPPQTITPQSLQGKTPEELTLLLIKLRRQQAELNSLREHTVAQLMALGMEGPNAKAKCSIDSFFCTFPFSPVTFAASSPPCSVAPVQTDVLSHHLQRNLIYLENQVSPDDFKESSLSQCTEEPKIDTKLSRLCEQDKAVRMQEEKMQQLHREKELERYWREYDRLEADVTQAKSHLLEQLEALGSPQTVTPLPLSPLKEGNSVPSRPPLPQYYDLSDPPPHVPPHHSSGRLPPHTVRPEDRKAGSRNGAHSQAPDYRLYKSEPELTTVKEEVDEANVPPYPVGIVPPRTKSPMSTPESSTIASYVTLRKSKKPESRSDRPRSAVDQLGFGEREVGRTRMSVEEQLDRMRRNQEASSLREKKRETPSRSASFSKDNPFVNMQEVQGTEKVKNDKREETQQGRAVTLHSGKEQQAETNSIDNETILQDAPEQIWEGRLGRYQVAAWNHYPYQKDDPNCGIFVIQVIVGSMLSGFILYDHTVN